MTSPAEDEPRYESDETLEPSMILGGISGPVRTHGTVTLMKGGAEITLSTPKETRYLLVLELDKQIQVYRWEAQFDPPWQDIPKIRESTGEFLEQLEGFGEDEETQAAQFRREQRRPGTALHTVFDPERQYQRRGAIPGHKLDHTGGKKYETYFRRHSQMIPIGTTGFALDPDRREIRRLPQSA